MNYLEFLLSDRNYLTLRNDLLNDSQGNRTGFATVYTSHTLGIAHHFNELVTIRPEVRYETAYAGGVTPYDNSTKKINLPPQPIGRSILNGNQNPAPAHTGDNC